MINPCHAVSSCFGNELALPTALRQRAANRLFFVINDGNGHAIMKFQTHTKNRYRDKDLKKKIGSLTIYFLLDIIMACPKTGS
jgi:hypothetical protein